MNLQLKIFLKSRVYCTTMTDDKKKLMLTFFSYLLPELSTVVLYFGCSARNSNLKLTLTVVQIITYYTLPYFSSLYSFSLLPKNYAILGWAGVAKLKNEQNAPCLFHKNSFSQICTLLRCSNKRNQL